MKKQFQVSVNAGKAIVIDIHDDESISMSVHYPPTKFSEGGKDLYKPHYKIDGLRWRDGEHYHLGWLEDELKIGDSITITLKESDEEATPLNKEEKYVAPEMKCSFCDRPANKVKHLVDAGLMARICDECVKLCQEAIDEREAT